MFGSYFGAGYYGDGYWGPGESVAPPIVVVGTGGGHKKAKAPKKKQLPAAPLPPSWGTEFQLLALSVLEDERRG